MAPHGQLPPRALRRRDQGELQHGPPGPGHLRLLAASRTDDPSAAEQQGVIPIGYGDGIPSTAVNLPVRVGDRLLHSEDRVWMDQFVIRLGAGGAQSGTECVLFGDGAQGDPTIEDWAEAAGVTTYEIITRIGASIPRRYVGR